MKNFTHGTICNFYESSREMTCSELKNLIIINDKSLFGEISFEAGEIFLFGKLQDIEFGDQIKIGYEVTVEYEQKSMNLCQPSKNLILSQEACFDILTEENKQQKVTVWYLTVLDNTEKTYFIISSDIVNPLFYVIDFWDKVKDVGKEVDFSKVSCRLISK